MTTTYKARAGSVADRTIERRKADGATAGAPLADAIDADFSSLLPSLSTAMAFGAVKRMKRGGLWWYDIGDGKPLKRDDDREEEDDAPIVQRVVPHMFAQPMGLAGATRRPETAKETTQRSAVTGVGEDAKRDGGPASPGGFEASFPVAKPEVAPDLRITLSIECTPHQAERISAFVREMREVA